MWSAWLVRVEKNITKGVKKYWKVWKKDFHLKNNFSYFSFTLERESWSEAPGRGKNEHRSLVASRIATEKYAYMFIALLSTESSGRRGTKDIFKQ